MAAVLADQMFRKQIGRILLAPDFDEFYAAVPDSLLNPKALCVNMAQLA